MGCGASSALDDAQRRIVRLEAAIADMEKKTQAQAQVQPTSTNSADPDDNQRAQSQPPKAAEPAAAESADNEHVHPFGVNQSVPVAVDSAAVAAAAARAAEFAALQNELAQLRIECASNQATNDAELKRADAAIVALQAAAAKRNDEPPPPSVQQSSPSVAVSADVPAVTSEEFERLESRVTTAAAAVAASEEKWQSALATETAERKREQAALQTNLTAAIETVKDAQPKAKSPAIVIKAGAGAGAGPGAGPAPATAAADAEAAIASARKEAADANAATGALLAALRLDLTASKELASAAHKAAADAHKAAVDAHAAATKAMEAAAAAAAAAAALSTASSASDGARVAELASVRAQAAAAEKVANEAAAVAKQAAQAAAQANESVQKQQRQQQSIALASGAPSATVAVSSVAAPAPAPAAAPAASTAVVSASGGVDASRNSGPAKPFVFPPAVAPSASVRQGRQIEFDVFLSHKRTDAQDLARTLKSELTAGHGMRVFLDQDADFQLGDLMSRVRQSAAMVFILSSHIFESEWCLLELREALLWGLNIILLTPQGSHWTFNGRVHEFPPAQLIPPEVAAAFSHKAVDYMRNFHSASMEALLSRIYGGPVSVHLGELAWSNKKNDSRVRTLALIEKGKATTELAVPSERPLQSLLGLCAFKSFGDIRVAQRNGDQQWPETPFLLQWKVAPTLLDPHSGPLSAEQSGERTIVGRLKSNFDLGPETVLDEHRWNVLMMSAAPQRVQCAVWPPTGKKPKVAAAAADGSKRTIALLHPHELTYRSKAADGAFTCDHCGGSGKGAVYSCAACDSHFHAKCVDAAVATPDKLVLQSYSGGRSGRWWHTHTRAVTFATPFATPPKVFVALRSVRMMPAGEYADRSLEKHPPSMRLLAGPASPSGFELGLDLSECRVDDLSLQYLAFEPRSMKGWRTGDFEFHSLEGDFPNKRVFDVRRSRRLVNFAVVSGETPLQLTKPPLVFLACNGLTAVKGRALDFSFSVQQVNTSSFEIHCQWGFADRWPQQDRSIVYGSWIIVPQE